MALYSIADLHLSEGVDKPMDIFGYRWQGYTDKIVKRWRAVVNDGDTVVIAGDISWALDSADCVPDMKLIDSLPGTKIITKGNHDLWWSTVTKMQKLFDENDITTIKFLYNNAYETEDFILAGTRGWYVEERLQNTVGDADYNKIVARECGRLRLSLNSALKLKEASPEKEILVYFHFPPVFGDYICREIVEVLHEYNVKRCYFGHIHSQYNLPSSVEFEGIRMTLISADFLDFIPMITLPEGK